MLAGSLVTAVVPMHKLEYFDRMRQHPRPAHPTLSGESEFWSGEHPADVLAGFQTSPASA